MRKVFVGSEMLKNGAITRAGLRWNFRPILPDVYVPVGAEPSLQQHVVGAWLWSHRRAVIAGRAAAALHGALWVHADTPVELIWPNARPPAGIITRDEKIADDEIFLIHGMAVTTPERTAFDLARHLPRDLAVRHLDALARATGVTADDALILADRHPRARRIRACAEPLDLMDPGAQSPRETWLRLLFIDEGFPRPRTQIRVSDGRNVAFLDMGWDEPMIGADYDGEQHQSNRPRFVHDIGRNELVSAQGWLDLHVVAEHSRAFIVHRAMEAFSRRGHPLRLRSRS